MTTKRGGSRDALEFLDELLGGPPTLGQVLKSFRQCEEWSQKDCAKKLRISPQHLNDIEHDRKSVSPELAARYARLLKQSEMHFVQLALQDKLSKAKLKYTVELRAAS